MDRTGFENLHVYQLAETLSDLIWKIPETELKDSTDD